MENYDLKGVIVEGNKAVIAILLPELTSEILPKNKYEIFEIHNISDDKGNKIVIHFKDLIGEELCSNGNIELFKIDLNIIKNQENARQIDFTKIINVALIHENLNKLGNLEEIYIRAHKPKHTVIKENKTKLEIDIPDTTGRGTIRESV